MAIYADRSNPAHLMDRAVLASASHRIRQKYDVGRKVIEQLSALVARWRGKGDALAQRYNDLADCLT